MEKLTQQRQQFTLKKGVEKEIILFTSVTTENTEFQLEYPRFHASEFKSIYATLKNAFEQTVGKPINLHHDGITKFNMMSELEQTPSEYLFLVLKADFDVIVSLSVFVNTESAFIK